MTTGVVFNPFHVIYDESTCPAQGCSEPRYLDQLCKYHDGLVYENRLLFGGGSENLIWCLIEGCRAKTGGRLCQEHHRQFHSGEPIRPKEYRRIRDIQNRKYCRSCDTWRAEDSFHQNFAISDRLSSTCKHCCRYRQYNLNEADYKDLLDRQGNTCMICKTTDPGPKDWNIDHDHSCCPGPSSCGECVRGILCLACNVGLGFFRDNADSLERAITYLDAEKRSSLNLSNEIKT